MAVARVWSATLWGVVGRVVEVQVAVGPGLPALDLLGLPEGAARQARHRLRTALRQAGVRLPGRRLTASLLPADLAKQPTACDLALAVGLLACVGRVAVRDDAAYVGEVGLDGSLRPVRGTLAMALAVRRAGLRRLVVPAAAAPDVAAVPGLEAVPVCHLVELWGAPAPARPRERHDPIAVAAADEPVPDWAEVVGQPGLRRALEVAAAGRHHAWLVGPPGVGKTLLIRGLPGVLPPLAGEEGLEVAAIAEVAGEGLAGPWPRRPFRAPHPGTTPAGLVGGGNPPQPGEVTRAHGGVLFLDELTAFRRDALDALRLPMEEGVVRLARVGGDGVLPARCLVVAACHSCPCGRGAAGDDRAACTCSPAALRRHREALPQPLLDRFDLWVRAGAPPDAPLPDGAGESSAPVRHRVEQAWEARRARARRLGVDLDGPLPLQRALQAAALDAQAGRLLDEAARRLPLSGRGLVAVLRVARTVADLAGAEAVGEDHVAEALQYRMPPWG